MRTWKAEGRNGYHAVDEFKDGTCTRMVIAVRSAKDAGLIAGALADAYRHGQEEASTS